MAARLAEDLMAVVRELVHEEMERSREDVLS
jgi:hypothetical protein